MEINRGDAASPSSLLASANNGEMLVQVGVELCGGRGFSDCFSTGTVQKRR